MAMTLRPDVLYTLHTQILCYIHKEGRVEVYQTSSSCAMSQRQPQGACANCRLTIPAPSKKCLLKSCKKLLIHWLSSTETKQT